LSVPYDGRTKMSISDRNRSGFPKIDFIRCTMRFEMRRTTALFLAMLAFLGVGAAAPAQTLSIAAASDLQAVLPTLAERFERQAGVAPRLTFGSSGNFFSQIQNGAPFDVFLSADLGYPQQLVAANLAFGDTLYEYASGRLVVWARKDAGIDVERGLRVLTDPRVRRIAIANPEHAPYGRAAVAALRHEQLYEAVRSKLVLGENISQAAQFAESGNADVGILALSVALAPALKSGGVYAEIPSGMYPPIRQAVVVVRTSRNPKAARAFIEFLKQPDSVKLLADFGFSVPRD
jgi:molybdate transport system substrate-binding protein